MQSGTHQVGNNIEICIPLNPITKKNSQRILYKYNRGKKIPFISPSEAFENFQEDCGYFVKPLNIGYPVNVEAKYFMKKRYKVDLSNLNSSIHDILVHYKCIKDDSAKYIVSTDGSRVYYDKDNPRVEIIITREEKTFV